MGHRLLPRRLPVAVRRQHGDRRSSARGSLRRRCRRRRSTMPTTGSAIARWSSPRSPTPTRWRWAWRATTTPPSTWWSWLGAVSPTARPTSVPSRRSGSTRSGRSPPRSPGVSPGGKSRASPRRWPSSAGCSSRGSAPDSSPSASTAASPGRASSTSRATIAQIEDVNTLEEFRGRGVARNVVLRAAEEAARSGATFVFLFADAAGLASPPLRPARFRRGRAEPAVHAVARGHRAGRTAAKSPGEP